MHHYYEDMKIHFVIMILLFSLLGCTEKNDKSTDTKTQTRSVIESYTLKFLPAFHNDLEMEFAIYSNETIKLTLKQNSRVMLFDSVPFFFNSSRDSLKTLPLVKPNFIIEYTLTYNEFQSFSRNLQEIEDNCVKPKDPELYGEDGMTIIFESEKGAIKKTGTFWSPSKSSNVGKAFINILEMLEKNPSGIIEKTAEKIKFYIDENEWMFKLVSKNPLYVKVLDTPCCPCQLGINNFMKTLPDDDEIYLDITHYGFYERKNEDMSCLENEFKKKYKHVIWVMNEDDNDRFRELINE